MLVSVYFLPAHTGVTAATVEGGHGVDESRGVMSASEKIVIVQDQVAGLQNQLDTVGSILDSAEQITVAAEKTGRGLRRFFKVLLFISIVAVAVALIKKLMGDRCFMSGEEEVVVETETTSEGVDTDPEEVDADPDEAAPDGDADAS